MRVNAGFSRLLRLDGIWVRRVAFEADRVVVGVALIASKIKGRKDHVPFGPFLAAGTLITILWGAPILHWYSGS